MTEIKRVGVGGEFGMRQIRRAVDENAFILKLREPRLLGHFPGLEGRHVRRPARKDRIALFEEGGDDLLSVGDAGVEHGQRVDLVCLDGMRPSGIGPHLPGQRDRHGRSVLDEFSCQSPGFIENLFRRVNRPLQPPAHSFRGLKDFSR